MVKIVPLALLFGMLTASAMAAPPSTVTTGSALAKQYCSECHVVAPSSSRGWTDAPPFDSVANRPNSNISALTAFIEKPHRHMLNTQRPPAEAQALASYIMSLRKP